MDEDQCSSWLLRTKFSHGKNHHRSGSLDLTEAALSEPSKFISRTTAKPNTSFRDVGNSCFSFWQDAPDGKPKPNSSDSEFGLVDGRVAVSMIPKPIKTNSKEAGVEFDRKKPVSVSDTNSSSSGSSSPLANLRSRVVSVYSRRFDADSDSVNSPVFFEKRGRDSKPKKRSKSPLPTVIVSDVFKEARSVSKRFSSPQPRRKSDKNREFRGFGLPSSPTASSLFRHLSPMKSRERLKSRKENVWSRYFDNGGGRVIALETTEKWNVNLSELYIGHRFACGAHSKLYKGIYNDKPVAIKIIRQPDDDENGEMAAKLEKQFIREVTILSHLYHPNVIKLEGACRDPPVFCIITEYISGGSFRAFLHKLDHKPLPLPKLICFALDIARGMEYIHSHGIIHRDLKPENILIDKDFCLKIVDFGIACEEVYCDVLAEDAGTYRWMAPEMIKHKPYGRKVDVYSFGLLLWEMVTGTIPYEDMTPIQAAFAVVNRKSRLPIPDECPAPLKTLIEQCWSMHAEKRPEFWEIVKTLEQLEYALVQDGTLEKCQILLCQDQKKGLVHWVQKLKPVHPEVSGA